ncbi:MAG: ABC transporter substrate-binding protein [Holosporaceae bacterium]|jgi:ABC-type glycerol-3-phosphate transport system substrate-binding protein|nr:ABC transporter substrate-binding protein [Holosporaceae bacterium]
MHKYKKQTIYAIASKKNRRFFLMILCLLLEGCFPVSRQEREYPKKIVFTILFGQSNSDPGIEDMLTEKINAEFPDVTLEWESVDWGDYFSSEIRAKIASGEVPDLIIGKAQDVATYQPSGFLAPFSREEYAKIEKNVLDSVTINGGVYGLPYNAFYQGVLYNKNIFWRYGLEVPTSPEEMEKVIQCLEEVGITPFAAHFRENWYAGNITMQFAINQVFAKNSKWGEEFRSGLHSFVESKDYTACFCQVETIWKHTWPDAATVNQSECAKRFANEEAAMYLTGTWAVQPIFSIRQKMTIGIFPYPNETGDARLIFEPNLTFMKNAESPNLQLAESVLAAIYRDTELAKTICDFTITTSLLSGVETDSLRQVEQDINAYKEMGKVVDVTTGNRQIVWSFQAACAVQINAWLAGKVEFKDILQFADDNRFESGGVFR